MTRPSRTGIAPRREAFTLVELMVALTVGGLTIGSIYFMASTVTRQYHQQYQAANALTSLRVALNQVKRDIARAGFMSIPNLVPATPHASEGCATTYAEHAPAPGSGSLAGISRFNDNVCGTGSACDNLDNANAANGFTADSLVLFANYETASEYPGVQLVTASTIAIARTSHAYQTDFTTWYNTGSALWDPDAFQRAFAPGRLIRIRMTNGLLHFARISAGGIAAETGTTDVQVTFTPAVPATPINCVDMVDGGSVAPVSAIRYYPRNDPSPPSPNPWGPMVQLVREEVQPGNKATPLALVDPTDTSFQYTNTRVVLDYMVAFNLGFVAKGADAAVGSVDSYTAGNDTATAATVNATPERVRAVTIDLSARTPEQDRSLISGVLSGSTWTATACAALACYQVFANAPGAARVRTLRTEVFIPNIALEGY